MSEKLPQSGHRKRDSTVVKFIGSNLERNEKMRGLFKKRFESDYFDPLEREKTGEEKKFLEDVNQRMAEFIKRYGGNPVEMPANLIKFLDWSKLSADQAQLLATAYGDGFFCLDTQGVAIFSGTSSAYPDRMGLANTIDHELIHANSFQSIIVNPNKDFSARQDRVGLSIEDDRLFKDLNEAITAELNIRFHNEFLKDIEFTAEEFKKLGKDIEDIKVHVKDPSKFNDIASIHRIPLPDGSSQASIHAFEYGPLRFKLNKIIDKINELNPSLFNDREEIFDIFAKAMITGEVRQLTDLIENTFGRGTFKKLASGLDIFEKENENEKDKDKEI